MADKREKMDETQLEAILRHEIDNAIGSDDSELSKRRALAIQYIEGDADIIPHEDGWSSVVSTDVADAIGWILPSLMRTFASSDNLGEVLPLSPKDEEGAQQASDYINAKFWGECEGYRVLYNGITEGLSFGNGLVKVWWEDEERDEVFEYTNMSDEAYVYLVSQDNVEVLEHEEYQMLDEMGAPTTTHEVKIRVTEKYGCLKVESLPPEEFLINKDAKTTDDARFVAHKFARSRGDLIADGYDKDAIMGLGTSQQIEDADEYLARHQDEIAEGEDSGTLDPMSVEVEVVECYVRVDYDGDDYPEWRRVVMGLASSKYVLLEEEEWPDELPFVDFAPDPRPHRWEGNSVWNDLKQQQDIKTVIKRQTLDNLYLSNHPMKMVAVNRIENMDALTSPQVGGLVRVKGGSVGDAVADLVVPFVGAQSLNILEYIDMESEKRTGVSRQSMALDPEALSNQTATGVQAAQSSAYAKIELYARNLAEGGIKRLLTKMYKLVCKNASKPEMIKLRGKWVEMDPTQWNPEMKVNINVGLGSGSRDRDMAMLAQVAAKQEQILLQMGPSNPLCDLEQYGRTLQKLTEVSGLKNPELYFKDIDPQALQQMQQQQGQKPDPKAEEAKAKIEIEKAKAQAKAQLDQQKMQFETQQKQMQMQVDAQMQERENQMKMELQRQMQDAKIAFMEREAALNLQLREKEMALEYELTRQKNEMNAAVGAMKNRPDTNLDPQNV
jgi:hypothetical protein